MPNFEEINTLSPYNKNDSVLKITIDSKSDTYRLKDVISQKDTYTFTIWYKSDSQTTIAFNILGKNFEVESNSQWNKFIKKINIENLNNKNIDITPALNSVTYYYEAYLVRGSVDSSWTPAPEDVDDKVKVLSSKFEQTSEHILSRVENTEKGYTELKLTAKNIKQEVASLDGRVSTQEQTSGEIMSKVEKLGDGYSQVRQDVDTITHEVADAKGNNATLKVKFDSVETKVADNAGNISDVVQKADAISKRVEDVNKNLSSQITQTSKEIRQEVADADKSLASQITQTAETINQRITNEKQGLESQITQSSKDVLIQVSDKHYDKDTVDSMIKVESDRITSTVTKVDNSIKSSKEQFYLSSSPTALQGGSWSNTQPSWQEGKYIWRRTLITKNDDTTEYTPSENGVCITGNTGRPGADGKPGTDSAIQSPTEPEDKTLMWLDTSVDPPLLKQWNGKEWVIVNDTTTEIESLREELKSEIKQESDGVRIEVGQNYYTKDEAQQLQSSINTRFEQTKNDFTFSFNEINKDLQNLENDTNEGFQNISKYIRFIDGNIEMGAIGNEFKQFLTRTKNSFLQNGVEIAYFGNRKMYVTDGEFTNSLQVGNFGFIPEDNGSLSFRKVR